MRRHGRRQPLLSQEENPHQELTLPDSNLDFQPPELGEMPVVQGVQSEVFVMAVQAD